MLSFLSDILYAILDLPYLLVGLLVESLNGWILILAGLISLILSLLPGFPELPALPADVVAGVAWFLPVGEMVAVLAVFVAAWLVWMGYQVALRWAKAL